MNPTLKESVEIFQKFGDKDSIATETVEKLWEIVKKQTKVIDEIYNQTKSCKYNTVEELLQEKELYSRKDLLETHEEIFDICKKSLQETNKLLST